ncbi:MAG: hypothetical protein D6791_17130 [Chloroflexi bacterium]|nr:MAG: hypothetical protein D6791_17130 [Chloroflexota bacterium]
MIWHTTVYLLKQNAPQEGLAFAMPSWWDVERLFEANAKRRIVLPDGREVLLLEQDRVLGFDPGGRRTIWKLPQREIKDPEIEQQRTDLLDVVKKARWFIVEREQVWIVPAHSRPGCEVWDPGWWSSFYTDKVKDFREWYESFRESHRLDKRCFDMSNPIQGVFVELVTASEAQEMDEHYRKAYQVALKRSELKLSPYPRKRMARFAQALQQAEWVILYHWSE